MATAISKEELQKLLDDGLKVREIAEKCSLSVPYVYELVGKYGIRLDRCRRHSEAELQRIQQLLDSGISVTDVARIMGTTRDSMAYVVHKYKLKVRKDIKRHGNNKLMQITHQYYKENMSISDIATNWGVSEAEMRAWMVKSHIIKPQNSYAIKPKKRIVDDSVQMSNAYLDSMFRECPQCGKQYMCRSISDWAYKFRPVNIDKNVAYCSWTCLQKAKAEDASKRKNKKYDSVEDYLYA